MMSCAQGYCAPILLKCISPRDKWLKMVAKGAGTEQSCLKYLNYKTTSMDCNKTAGRTCNKSAGTEALFTARFTWEPESASHVEGETKGEQQGCSSGWIPDDIYRHLGLDFTGDRFFFSHYFFMGVVESSYRMHSLCPWLLRHSGLGNRLVQQMNACVTALLPREVQQDPT